MKTEPNQPAFPVSEETTDRIDQGIKIYSGISKREYFAAMAMQGLLASFTEKAAIGAWGSELELVAKTATEVADAIMKVLNKTKP